MAWTLSVLTSSSSRLWKSSAEPEREAGDLEVAHLAVGHDLADDVLALDDVAGDAEVLGLAGSIDRDGHGRALGPAQLAGDIVDGHARRRGVVDGDDHVAVRHAGLLRGRVAHDVGDRQQARVGHRVARVARRVLGRDLNAHAGELARQATQGLGVLLLGQVLRERVAQGREQPADGALDERVLVDRRLAHVVLGDVVVRVPERAEEILVVCRGARRGAGEPTQGEARDEQPGAADGDDQEDRQQGGPARPAPVRIVGIRLGDVVSGDSGSCRSGSSGEIGHAPGRDLEMDGAAQSRSGRAKPVLASRAGRMTRAGSGCGRSASPSHRRLPAVPRGANRRAAAPRTSHWLRREC